MREWAMVVVAALLAGCATPNEVRQRAPHREFQVSRSPAEVRTCIGPAMDEAIMGFGLTHLVRENGDMVSVISRNLETTLAVTDIRPAARGSDVTIHIGPTIFSRDTFAAGVEKAVRECGGAPQK
jgi:hypothetical protein